MARAVHLCPTSGSRGKKGGIRAGLINGARNCTVRDEGTLGGRKQGKM